MLSCFQLTTAAATLAVAALSVGIGKADEPQLRARSDRASRSAHVEQGLSSVTVTLDFAKILSFPQPARTIIIGNPAIVDGTLNNETTIVLTGKAVGTTNMIVLGEAQEEIANLTITVAGNTRQLTTIHHGVIQQIYSCSGPCRPVSSPAESK